MGYNPQNFLLKINNILKMRCTFCLSVLWSTFLSVHPAQPAVVGVFRYRQTVIYFTPQGD